MKSPFPYERIAHDKTFYGRKKEIAHIQRILEHSNNLLLYSKRRIGKSSLGQEVGAASKSR